MKRNPPWNREELILALDLYFEFSTPRFSASNPAIIQLSEILNKLPRQNDRPDAARFRNPNGTSMKLSNFLRFDSKYSGVGLERGGKLEETIWSEFAGKRDALRAAADAVRATITK